MRRDWLQAATNLSAATTTATLSEAVAGLGVAIAIGGMEWFSPASHYPLVIIPFATSIMLVVGSPEVEPAQPRTLIGGHVTATLVGLAMLRLTGPHARAAAAAAMYVTGTFHPPAGINPLLVVSNNLPWSFLFVPVLAGALLPTAFAYVWHRRMRRRPWSQRWL